MAADPRRRRAPRIRFARSLRRRDLCLRRRRVSRRRPAETARNPGKVALARAPRLIAAVAAVMLLRSSFARAARADDPARPAVRRPHRVGALGRPVQPARLPDAGRPGGAPASSAPPPGRRGVDRGARSSPDADTPGMREQFLCHWQLAEFAEPGKTSWNLEPWRPEVDAADDDRSRLQPRRHRRAVLVPALDPRRRGRARRPHPAQAGGHRRRRRRARRRGGRTRGVRGVRVAVDGCGRRSSAPGGSAHRRGRGIPVGQAPFGDQGRGGRAGGRRRAPARSTWSSTSGPRWPATSTRCAPISPRSAPPCPVRCSR